MLLLLDGKNLVYRAVFANQSLSTVKTHHVHLVLRLMKFALDQVKPKKLMVFWDAPSKEVWRKKLFAEYKNRDGAYQESVTEDVNSTLETLYELMPHLNAYQFKKDYMEADDLIYSASRLFRNEQCVIYSNDGDYAQIPYRMENVKLFSPKTKEYLPTCDYDPAVLKSLSGDPSDKIPGYKGIGKVKGTALAKSVSDRIKFLKDNGHKTFKENMRLIDLSLCPFLLENELYISKHYSEQAPVVNRTEVINIISKYRIAGGLISEIDNLLFSFKSLNKEKELVQ